MGYLNLGVVLLILSFGATSCSFIHVNTKPNYADDDEDIYFGISTNKGLASSGVASEDVPWDIYPVKCRNKVATFEERSKCPGNLDDLFLAVAISGGGSRSAVFSAQVLFELKHYGLLDKVDVMSSVSGGSYTAALYSLSCDRKDDCPKTVERTPRPLWNEKDVFEALQTNFMASWIANWFWPENIVRYWLTDYDKTDIMAETLSDNLFDTSYLGGEGFRFHDLNPRRPNLVINATNNTFFSSDINRVRHKFGKNPVDRAVRDLTAKHRFNFTFTKESFKDLKSNFDHFPISYAVAASSAFPGAFNYVTLQDFSSKDGDKYIHLYDGGAFDNLGLTALRRIILRQQKKSNWNNPTKVVILIDAFLPPVGESSDEGEPRSLGDYVVDTNFLDAYDTLMTSLRENLKENTVKLLDLEQKSFIHITFDELSGRDKPLYDLVARIGTSLSIDDNDANCLREAARILVKNKLSEFFASGIPKELAEEIASAPQQPEASAEFQCDKSVKKEDGSDADG